MLKKREVIAAIVIIIAVILYCLFWKPNPIIRLNLNRINASGAKPALYFDAPSEVNNAGRTITVKVVLDTKGNNINAVQSIIEFDPQSMEVVSTATQQSFCKFYPENYYDNTKGEVRLACGTPYPGFNGTNTLESIQFLTKATKTTKIKISDQSMVLANDGKGTNLLNDFQSFSIKIKPTL